MTKAILSTALVFTFSTVSCDWASGVGHVKCDFTETVNTNVESTVNQEISLNFCSPQVALPQQGPQTVKAQSTRQDYGSTVRVTKRDYDVMFGDGCVDSGHYGESQSVGSQIPLMTQQDLANFKFCYMPKANFQSKTNVNQVVQMELYIITARTQACPAGSSEFDQTSVACK